jgi:hypothetical protein
MTELDQVIAAARHADADAAERWFRLLCDPGRDGDGGAADTVAALRELDAPAAEMLELALGGLADPGQALREVRDLGPDAALARYDELLDMGPGAEAQETAEDPAAWNAFLAEKGPYWDGTEESWPQFRDWFAYEAGQAGVPGFAAAFLQYAQDAGDRAGVFAEYGLQRPGAGTGDLAEPGGAAEDPAAWNAFLAEKGPYWDGTEENWPQFRDQFAYDARENGVGRSAEDFLAFAEQQGKHEVFAQYGVPISGPGEPPGSTPGSGAADAGELMQALDADILAPALAEAMSRPELMTLGEDRLRQMLAQVITEQLARRAAQHS